MVGTRDPFALLDAIRSGSYVVTGKDGQRYILRPIRPTDAESLSRGYDAMSERAKWFRMLHAQQHISPEQAARFCAPDPAREICLVLEGRGRLKGEILGGARIARDDAGETAEFSVSLRPEAQGLGLARRALKTVLELAPTLGCRRVFGIIARENTAMLALARRLGFEVSEDQDDRSLLRATLKENT
jgi:RimJ/RimL family protein N-acetyltransferase